jgi:hypothetical protein
MISYGLDTHEYRYWYQLKSKKYIYDSSWRLDAQEFPKCNAESWKFNGPSAPELKLFLLMLRSIIFITNCNLVVASLVYFLHLD